jgi:hypothetical protein
MTQQREKNMRITFPSGIHIDVEEAEQAVKLILALGNGKPQPNLVPPVPGLSPALQELYEYLSGNDQEEGIALADLTNAFGIKASAMSQRLRQLENRDFATRVGRAMWRIA